MLSLALAAAFAMLASGRAAAVEPGTRPPVSALLAKSTAPYQRALAAFKRSYDGPVTTHVLEFEDDALERVRAEKPALVLAVGVRAAKLALGLGETPVVYCMVLDPAANGLTAPHVVGVPLEVPSQVQLAELRRLLPGARSVGMVFNPSRSAGAMNDALAAAAALSLTLVAEPAGSAAQFPDALQRLLPRSQALWLLADATVVTQDTFRLMLELAMAHKLPVLTFSDEFVRLGALFALAPDFEGAGVEAARLADAVVAGCKPSEVGPAQPRWKLVVNLSTARALGLTLPADALENAVVVH